MKKLSHLLSVAVLSISLALLTSCAKDTVSPYISSDQVEGSDAKNIEYSGSDHTYSDTSPSEESLDSVASLDSTGSFDTGADQNSDEFKKMYGRSSQQMLPIYFEFDQATIKMDQIPKLEQNATYLKDNPSAKIVIEGNCDERGTNEYNLALGERRALNAKTYLIELGIEDYRIRTVSYGEERPLFPGEDEFSWSQNRRDDFVLE
jgi:peptidoglycan-associated lipoprotein